MDQGSGKHTLLQGEDLFAVAHRYGVSMTRLLAANPRYKAEPSKARIGDELSIPEIQADASPVRFDGLGAHLQDRGIEVDHNPVPDHFWLQVARGQLTFDAEGSEERGRGFSRKPRVPSASSGVVIGRGYQLRDRSEAEICCDLAEAGIAENQARALASCRHLTGAKARKFVQDLGYNKIEISLSAQFDLFKLLYAELEGDICRICNRLDVQEKYGVVDWTGTYPVIRDVIVDLHLCGDYTAATRERLQPALVNNSVDELAAVLSDRYYWGELRGVAPERFTARRDALSQQPAAVTPA